MSEIFCDNCEHVFKKQSKINGKVIEEYDNIYGCYCPECGFFIKPDKEIKIIKENKQKINILRKKMLNKLRRYRDGY